MQMQVITKDNQIIDRYKNSYKLRIKQAIYKNGILRIDIDEKNMTAKEKRECGLHRGKRKIKHFYKK